MPAATSTTRIVVPHKLKWHQRLVASLIYAFIRLFAATMRFRVGNSGNRVLNAQREPMIFCTWHNRLVLAMPVRRIITDRSVDHPMAALVSASKDGGIVARILEHFDVQPVRGSSSRRGPQALLELKTLTEQGYDIAFTPDGPRGPCYEVQDGAVSLAQLTGLPLVACAYHINWKISLKSWDRFQIPLPFARVDVEFGTPIRIPREATPEERERLRLQFQEGFMAITKD